MSPAPSRGQDGHGKDQLHGGFSYHAARLLTSRDHRGLRCDQAEPLCAGALPSPRKEHVHASENSRHHVFPDEGRVESIATMSAGPLYLSVFFMSLVALCYLEYFGARSDSSSLYIENKHAIAVNRLSGEHHLKIHLTPSPAHQVSRLFGVESGLPSKTSLAWPLSDTL